MLTDPGGPVGTDAAIIAVDHAADPTPPGGELEDGLRYMVGDGALVARVLRPNWQANGEALDELAARTAAIAARRGI